MLLLHLFIQFSKKMNTDFKSEPAKTSLVICIGFVVVYLLLDEIWALYVSVIIGGLSILSPWVTRRIEMIWFAIAKVLGYIVPNVLLTIIFYCALFPVACLSKVFKKTDPLKLKDKYESMYVTVDQEIEKESFERPF